MDIKKSKSKKVVSFSEDERAAMKERFDELNADESEGESRVLAIIDQMSGPDRTLAIRLHKLIKATTPSLIPKTWYGMPAYANEQGRVICFFQNAGRFKARYATFGFSDKARLDDGNMWPISWALKELTPAEETRIRTLLKKAVK